jgi:hypothetical protein
MVARGTAEMQDYNVESSTLQLIVDQLEELIVTVVEEIRERPGVAAAILAGVVGATVGGMLAARAARRRRAPVPARVPARMARQARGLGDAADLFGLSVRLLQNPIVRALILASLERQMKRRFAR